MVESNIFQHKAHVNSDLAFRAQERREEKKELDDFCF